MQRDKRDDSTSRKAYRRHFLRTLPTIGAILLGAIVVGLVSEVFLRSMRPPPEQGYVDYASLQAPFALALTSLQAALPIVAGLVAAPLLAAHLLHDLEATDSVMEAHDRLNQFLFGALGAEPKLKVRGARLTSGKESVPARVGGPASLTVYGDTAVVTEHRGRLKRVLGAGTHTLERYEKIWDLVDLRPQRCVCEIYALTKEGIPISCEVDVLFQIADSLENGRSTQSSRNTTEERPYAYCEEAVLRAATSKWVQSGDEDKGDGSWADRIVRLVEGGVRHILAMYRLDWLIEAPQPDQEHPRDEIRQRIETELADRIASVGAELLDIELGQIEVTVQDEEGSRDEALSERLSEIVSQQWIEAWNASWKARALTSRAEGEAELLRIDTARIEAQAEMVIALAEALQPLIADEGTSESYLLALRLVEALRWMSYDPKSRDFMAPEAMRTLKRLRTLLDSEGSFSDAVGELGQRGEGA